MSGRGWSCLDRPGAGPRLCGTCRTGLQEAVAGLVDDYDRLTVALGWTPAPTESQITGGKPKSKPPINLHIEALRAHLVYSAAAWEDVLRVHCKLSTRRNGAVRERYAVAAAVSIIAPRIDVLLTLPPTNGYFDGSAGGLVRRDGLEGARRLVRLHEAVLRTVGLTPIEVRLPGDCPACAARDLRRPVGTDTVTCANCESRWTYEDYTRHVRLMIDVG